jgi:hypothetical protein
MYKYLKRNELTACMRSYCLGDFQACRRYKLRVSGKPVPPNLLPDGSLKPEEARPEEPAPALPPAKEGVRTLL